MVVLDGQSGTVLIEALFNHPDLNDALLVLDEAEEIRCLESLSSVLRVS